MTRSKRALDLVSATMGLAVLSPALLLIALLVKAGDRGPVLFRQVRIGKDGRPFEMLKFRTMRVMAEREGGPLTMGADRRITPVGMWLRKFKLDELPQLWNVVRGEMSLVGPRPEVPDFVDLYTPDQRRVLELMPGITDPASIRFADEAALLGAEPDPHRAYVDIIMPEKIHINLEYAARANLRADVTQILKTLSCLYGLR
jgi:lipopolysaccharide/colanic/teichoic acid biosynthesis glycosyltransferase